MCTWVPYRLINDPFCATNFLEADCPQQPLNDDLRDGPTLVHAVSAPTTFVNVESSNLLTASTAASRKRRIGPPAPPPAGDDIFCDIKSQWGKKIFL